SVRRECRSLVVESLGEQAFARAVGLENAYRKITPRLSGKRDVVAAWRPHRRRVMSLAKADSCCRSAGCRHHVNLLRAAAVALEADATTIGRITGCGVNRRRIGETRGLLRPQVHHKQVGIATLLQAHDDALAVG